MKTLEKKSLFWDIDKPDPQKNRQFIIERILNLGDENDFHWAVDYYGEEKIKKAILESKAIARKSLFFWCQFFNIDKEKCLSNQSTLKQNAFWRR